MREREREEIKKHGVEGGWKEAKIDGVTVRHGGREQGKQGRGEEDTQRLTEVHWFVRELVNYSF